MSPPRLLSVCPRTRLCASVVHVGEVARSSAALALALCRAGPGFPSRRLYQVSGPSSLLPSPVLRRTRRKSARDGSPSFQGVRLRSENPLNINTGSSRTTRGTRFSGRFRETVLLQAGPAELAKDQLASPWNGSAMLPPEPWAPALVKSCERYRSNHLGSISPCAYYGTPNPEGQTPVQG